MITVGVEAKGPELPSEQFEYVKRLMCGHAGNNIQDPTGTASMSRPEEHQTDSSLNRLMGSH